MDNRIREFRERRGWSQSELAERVGVHWQTVQRVESGKTEPGTAKMSRYAEALGVSLEALRPMGADMRPVTVRGRLQAGEWRATWQWPESERYQVPVPDDPDLAPYELHAAILRGPSMNRRYPDGTVLVFTDMAETGEEPEIGARYVVERVRAEDGLAEATVKRLSQDADGQLWLVAESDDPRFQQSIALDPGDPAAARLAGRVRMAIVRE